MTSWRTALVTASSVARAGRSTEFYRACRRGEFERLAPGVHMARAMWQQLDDDERFLARIHATAAASPRPLIFSHLSAAALWGLPIVGRWPVRVDVTARRSGGGGSTAGYRARDSARMPEPVRRDGLLVTSLARTVVDVGRTMPLTVSVAMADAALASTTPQALLEELESIESPRGRKLCRLMLELADGRAGSAGESVSRVSMHIGGLPMPELQHEFYDRRGLAGIVDFWWPQFRLIGEFDGQGKYLREDLLGGKSTADALLEEKRREDRLRALNPGLTRWGWSVARSVPLLVEQLREAGLR